MQDIRTDLSERLERVIQERRALGQQLQALEGREQRLRALLQDEEGSPKRSQQLQLLSLPRRSDGARLREFVHRSLTNGRDWSLEELKEHARGMGLNIIGTSGRSLNITLVNLLREGSVKRLPNGRWRLCEQRKQLSLDLGRYIQSPREHDRTHARIIALMKFGAFIRILEAQGFALARQRGSHRAYTGIVERRGATCGRRRSSRERRYQARNTVFDDPTVGTAQEPLPPLNDSGGERHGELMALSVVTAREQPPNGMREEPQPDRDRHRAAKQARLLIRRKICHRLEIE